MVDVKDEEIKEVEGMIRDIINLVNVKKEEEIQGATQKIEDETAKMLDEKLSALAKKIGELGGEPVV